MAHAPLHPHSTTHAANGSVLPALRPAAASSSSGGVNDPLCFDVRALQGSATFDAHAFVTQCLHPTNPAFAQTADSGDAAASSQAAALLQMESEGLTLPAHLSPPALPLELLRDHLTRWQLFVKSELVELLNLEYARFIGLASSLSGLDRSIELIQSHLQQLSAEVEAIQSRIGSSALQPVERLLRQYQSEQNKQSYLHMIQFVLTETRNVATALRDNDEDARCSEEDEESAANSKQKHEEGVSVAHQRLSTQHLAASHARQAQRASDLKQQRRVADARGLGRSKRDASGQVHPAYSDLKLDIPPWMLQQYSGAANDSDADDADEGDAEAQEAETDASDAFGLYEALIKVPTQPHAETSTSAQLSSLRARLVRVERSSVALSSVRALLPLCAHFQLVRDLTHADGVSGTFDPLQARLQTQARDVLRSLIALVLSEYEQQAAAAADAATSFPAELLSLLRMSLRSLTFLDLRADAEDLVRSALVKPVLQSLVQAALPKLRAANALDESAYWAQHDNAETHPLRILYKQMLHFMHGPVQLMIQACCRAESNDVLTVSSLRPSAAAVAPAAIVPVATRSRILPFSFLSSSFFSELVSYLSSELGSVLFGSGLPHVFLAHYRATKWMLGAVESFALQVDRSVQSLHDHPSWAAFDKRWNVGIYFQLRFNTIAAAFEQAVQKAQAGQGAGLLAEYLADEPTSASASSSPHFVDFHLPVTRALWLALESCFSRRIFLAELSPRFLRLSLQCLARYCKMAEDLIASNSLASAAASSSAASSASAAAASSPLANAEVLFVLLASDASTLRELIPALQLPLIVKAVNPAGDKSVEEAVRGSFAPTLDRLAGLCASSQSSLTSLLLSRCTPALSYVSRIKPAYRFSRQPLHALQYVRAMLAPLVRLVQAADSGDLRALLRPGGGAHHGASGSEMDVNEGMADDAHDQDALEASVPVDARRRVYSASDRSAVLRAVVGQLSALYAEEATKCLSGDIFGELSKKLNKKTNVTAAAGSEVDKMRRQMQLDATLFARIAKDQLRTPDAEQIVKPLMQATQVSA